MNFDSKKIFSLYENVANLGPAAESPVGPSNNQHVVVSLPTGYATKDNSREENEEDWDQRRIEMVGTNLISINKNLKSIAEDFKKMKDVPPWVQEKLAICTQYMDDVSGYYDGKTLD